MDVPDLHRRFLDDVLPKIRRDPRVTGVALAGSLADGEPDVYSDVDLVIAVEDAAFDEVMADRMALIGSWTSLVAAFTGEHVGEPRLIITLVGPPLLHVDFKFVRSSDFSEKAAGPEAPDLQWIEDRFWVWVHYAATKLGRGELFEVIGFLNYLRDAVLGPLAAVRVGAVARGVRRLEAVAPREAEELRATVCGYDRAQAVRAVLASVELYLRWSGDLPVPVQRRREAEDSAMRYLRDVINQGAD